MRGDYSGSNMILLKDQPDSVKNDKEFSSPDKDDEDSRLDFISDSDDEENSLESSNSDDSTSEEPNNCNSEDLMKKCSEETGYDFEYIRLAEESIKEPIDLTTSIDDRPEWLDLEKFKRGQKFALDYNCGVTFSGLISLFLLFGIKPAPGTLIYTKNSDTPFKAFKRYLSTSNRIKLWCQGDVWGSDPNSPVRKSLETVRRMHKNVYLNLKDRTYDEVKNEMTFEKDGVDSSKFPTKDKMQEDLKGTCPMHPYFIEIQEKYKTKDHVWFSQAELIFTQFAFVGLAVRYPEYFGIYTATKEDFEGFIHFWRGIGYLMGIKDKYNLCNGDLDETRRKVDFMIQSVMIPNLKTVDVDWERMSRSVVDGTAFYMKGTSFEASLLYLCDILNVNVPKLKKSLSFLQYVSYLSLKFTFSFLMRIPGVMKFFSNRVLEKTNKLRNISPEMLAKWEATKFSYID